MKVRCPHCRQKYEVTDEHMGQTVVCSCGKEFVICHDQELSLNNIDSQQLKNNECENKINWRSRIYDIFHVKELRAQLNDQNRTIKELGLLDIIEKKKISEELELKVNSKINQLQELMQLIGQKETYLKQLDVQIVKINDLLAIDSLIVQKEKQLDELKTRIIETEEEAMMQAVGLYRPTYDFVSSEEYKERLNVIRVRQKDMIKIGTAVTGSSHWTVNGNAVQGKKMVSDMQKLLLRAFNGECEEITDKVTYANFDSSLKRIMSSFDAISRLAKIMSVAITDDYCQLKQDELRLAFEFRQKKQEEKERQKELNAQMREEAKVQRELEEARKKVEKEQTHYANALLLLQKQFETASEAEKQKLNEKKLELESKLDDINKSLEDIDYREANQRAGYVYIISNIGAFGENVYKIGMTRRLDPTERVDELGDASVPFNFDIHAIIFSENAPALEAALHRAFEKQKINWVNQRREFFNVTLDEIKSVVKANHDKTAEFIDIAPAEQYRISIKMQQENSSNALVEQDSMICISNDKQITAAQRA